jgi:MinD superfamily P-loop ATPase
MRIGDLGQVIVSPTSCNLCNKCVKNCPIGAIHRFNEFIYVCDLCGGDPRCVQVCTEGAISFNPDETGKMVLKQFKEGSKRKNVSEKRVTFVEKKGNKMRKEWRRQYA